MRSAKDKQPASPANPQVVSADKKLFVPMHMEAFVVTQSNDNLMWKSVSPAYEMLTDDSYSPLGKFMQAPICALPSPLRPKNFGTGVHLHWILPKAYRHGIQNENDDSPRFPFAPNRWLITRISEKDGKIITKRWIIESDYIHDDADDANWLLVEDKNESQPLMAGDTFRPVRIGKVYDYEKWEEQRSAQKLFLTIMSPCDPAFAANYNSCKNVFGFRDPLTDKDANTTYTYTVAGWISDPAKDILTDISNAAEWKARMGELSWYIEPDITIPEQPLPGGVICHAMINNITWNGKAVTQSSIPENEIRIGIGNTTAEALATLTTTYTREGFEKEVDPYLSALQYNVLSDHAVDNGWNILNKLKATDGPGAGTRVLKKQAHERGFQASSGGSVWVLSKKEKDNEGLLKKNESDHIEPLDIASSNLLNELNNLQNQSDHAINVLYSVQGQIYGNWYKEQLLHTNDRKKVFGLLTADEPVKRRTVKEIKKDTDRLTGLLGPLLSSSANGPVSEIVKGNYDKDIDKKKESLMAALAKAGMNDYELKESKMPPFHQPKDPVVVIEGLEPSAKYTQEGQILCRLEEQLADTIDYRQDIAPKVVTIRYSDLRDVPLPAFDKVHPSLRSLHIEALVLSPLPAKNGAAYAWNYKGSNTDIDMLATALRTLLKDPWSVKDWFKNKSHAAILPETYAATSREKQPWVPLFMEWEAEWTPTYQTLEHNDVLGKWEFGAGSDNKLLNNTDYVLKNDAAHAKTNKSFSYKGRVALASDLGRKLQDMRRAMGGKQIFSDMSPMYQSLSGLDNHFVLQESGIQLPPVSRGSDANTYPVDGVINKIGDQYLWNPVPSSEGFSPFRSGLFRLKNLFIVDAFGQNLPLINSYTDNKLRVNQFVSAGMDVVKTREKTGENGKEKEYIVLPPRICQPARMRFKWLSARDADNGLLREANTDPGTSPVCGWLLNNKLDNSIMVYSADGLPCGSIKATASNTLIWQPPPGMDVSKEISNTRLNNLVKSILGSDKITFTELQSQISAMAKKAAGARKTTGTVPNLPFGVPIAVAGALCNIELKGLPVRNWGANENKTDLSKVNFPFFIGNNLSRTDGVVGYFRTDNTNSSGKRMSLPFAQYVSDNNARMTINDPVKLSLGKELEQPAAENLTLLLHPYMDVTVSSGILPDATYRLSSFNIEKSLEQINFNFLVNPVLFAGDNDNIPVPDVAGKQWRWIEKQDKDDKGKPVIKWKQQNLLNVKLNTLTYKQVSAKEGWLQIEKKK